VPLRISACAGNEPVTNRVTATRLFALLDSGVHSGVEASFSFSISIFLPFLILILYRCYLYFFSRMYFVVSAAAVAVAVHLMRCSINESVKTVQLIPLLIKN